MALADVLLPAASGLLVALAILAGRRVKWPVRKRWARIALMAGAAYLGAGLVALVIAGSRLP